MRGISHTMGSGNTRRRRIRFTRFGLAASLVTGLLTSLGIALTATPALAAQALTCIDPAAAGSSATFIVGTAAKYTVECEEETGVSGTSAYPTVAVATDTLPADGNPALASGASCTTATSGSGATEEYIEECALSDTPTTADPSGSPYTATFTATPGSFTGSTLTPITSGTLTVTVKAATVSCIDPASGGSSTTFAEGVAASYTVECEDQSGISGVTAYPSSIAVASGALPADANQTFATSTSSTPPCVTGTSGSGATEEYILECKLAATTTPADASGSPYDFTFTATGPGGAGTVTSGTLAVTVAPATLACIDPASAGSSTTFFSSPAGNNNTYTVECYGQSGVSGITAYPTAIAFNTQNLPADVSFGTGCTTGTSGSGATEEYLLECPLTEDSVTADDGSYAATFTATGPGGDGSVTSGTLTVTVSPPTTTCSTPASGGTTASWVDGTAETVTLNCYSQGFTTSGAGDYPASITINSGSVPSDAAEATSLTSSPACTNATSGSGTAEEYELQCKITDTPVAADNGTYHASFLATGGTAGAPNTISGTLTINVNPPAPTWVTGQYFSAIKNVPFCDNVAVSNAASLPLTGITAGATPSGITNYSVQNVNLAAGTAQVCGTDTNTPATSGTPPALAPVATNGGGSATDSIPIGSQNECTWTSNSGTVSMFDTNQDLEVVGSQSAFGQPVTGGETVGTSTNYPTCSGDVMVAASGGLGDAWTVNTANPLPTPTDTNPSAAQGDLPSSNLELAKGCYGGVNILASYSYTSFGTSALLTVPSPWVNGGDCAYGSLGSNSAGGNTDTTNATCPPSQADVNEGYVDCTIVASSGNDENGSVNYSTLDLLFNGQPVPQTPTATLSSSTLQPGDTVNVTGGSNWWGSSGGAPNTGPYGDTQAGAFYQVSAPSVSIGTTRATAVPVVNSTVTIPGNTYVCTGAESTTVGPNPCTMTAGQPTGSFQVPSSLAAGVYNVYIDESNTTPLPGNGPNDSYQTARATNLGTAESATQVDVEGVMVVKTSTTSAYGTAGDTLTYNYAVTNTGPDSLSGITVNDNLIPAADISCPSPTLGGGDTENCSGTYTATQSDVDNGFVTNTATVSATTPSDEVLTSAPSSATVYATNATSSLTLTKSSTTAAYGAAGNAISYDYLVTNTGTTTLSGVAVSDDLVPDVSCPQPSLAPNASETCTGSYSVSQADVDDGFVTNTATASGTNGSNSTVTSNQSSVTVLASNATSTLSLTKSSTTAAYGAAGNSIGYDYLVTNTGTTTLSGVAVSDDLVAVVSCPQPSLAPNASETCTGSYSVTQADVDTGAVTNTATATATNPAAATVTSNQSSVTVPASNASSALTLSKTAVTAAYGAAGDTLDYDYLVTNTGTTTLSGIAVSDNLVTSVSCPQPSLAPGASETCTGSYTTTLDDVNNGSVTNTATASASNPSAQTVTSNQSSATVDATSAAAALSLGKTAGSPGFAHSGDSITYNYTLENIGTDSISAIAVSDDLIPSVTCPQSSLDPTQEETCSGTYTVTDADVANGSVTNTATASGTSDADESTVSSNQASATVDLETLTLAKSSTTAAYGAAGNVLAYDYVVTNTGPDTLRGIAVSDNKVASVSCPNSTLGSMASETCTGNYSVTQADVDAGSVTNSATASGSDPATETVTSGSSSATVYASNATSGLSLTKSSTTPAYGAAGDVLGYHYLVTNTGTTTLSGVAVSDNLVTSVTCPQPSLAPGASETCTGTYTVTQADVDTGSVTNTATATAANPASTTVTSNQSSVTVPASNATSVLTLAKSTTTTDYGQAGDTLNYNYLVKNTGSTTISGVVVADNLVPSVTCPQPNLAPGTSETCTGAYVATNADVVAGSVTNSATASGTNPSDQAITSNVSSVSVPSTYTATTSAPQSLTAALGGSNTDVALVRGNSVAGSPNAGTVTFYECGPTPSPTACTSMTHQVGSPVAVAPGGGALSRATSASFTSTSTGYWCFAAYYSGGADYAASSDATTDECYEVTAGSTSNHTAPTDSVIALGQADTDAGTVTGNAEGGSPTGSMSFYECGPTSSLARCTSKAHPVGSAVTLTPGAGNTAHATSDAFKPTAVGYWCFAGYYSGDANYQPSADTSVDECVDVLGPVTIVTGSLPNGTKGKSYLHSVAARGGKAPYSWSRTLGRLPKGLVLTKGGLVYGVAKKAGTFTFTLKVTDSSRPAQHASRTFTIVIAP